MFVCYSKTTYGWVEKLVGSSFLKKYAPKKGRTGFFVLCSLFIFICAFDLVFMQVIMYYKFVEVDNYTKLINQSLKIDGPFSSTIDELCTAKRELLKQIPKSEGLSSQLHDTSFFVTFHSLFSEK